MMEDRWEQIKKADQDLMDEGRRLRASWDKMMNYAATFNRGFGRVRKEFLTGKYGQVSFETWLMRNVGMPESRCIRMLRDIAPYARLSKEDVEEYKAKLKRKKAISMDEWLEGMKRGKKWVFTDDEL